MKKLFTILLSGIMAVSFAACSSADSSSSTTTFSANLPSADSASSTSSETIRETESIESQKTLIVYFSWGGNVKEIAEEIQSQIDADIFEITLVAPYSTDYNTVLDQAQEDQANQARPEIANQIDNMDEYDTILLGYPNWWSSIPMPIATFLEEYDFSGKTIIPFCSHGSGGFGQSLTAISTLAPNATMGEALSIEYLGGSTLQGDISEWLTTNNLSQ